MARAGAEVLVTGRNEEKGRTAIENIKRAMPSAKVPRDASSGEPRGHPRICRNMLANGRPLDLLINNAGVMDLPTGD